MVALDHFSASRLNMHKLSTNYVLGTGPHARSLTHLFIYHSFNNKCLWSSDCVPGTTLGAVGLAGADSHMASVYIRLLSGGERREINIRYKLQ